MNKKPSLGRSLIRAHKRNANNITTDGYRHTSDLDACNLGKLNLNSVTEQSSLDAFLDRAILAEKQYQEESLNIEIVDPNAANGIISEEEKALIASTQEENRAILCIPRRPAWNVDLSKEELDVQENESFRLWRQKLVDLQEKKYITLTPYEKNLEIWRQLWRVIERSDVVVQIVDARNPLLFRCPDLEAYVKEVDKKKLNVLLLNKADFLTENERHYWSDYFESIGIKIVFFSALNQLNQEEQPEEELADAESNPGSLKNDPKILSRDELIVYFKNMCRHAAADKSVFAVGLVGYPNVGKSSTINALLMSKKVSVSATPGKTKHFQTHLVDKELCLCDCPGLVFPNLVSSKSEMVINGILPIDQLTNWAQPVNLITQMIPRNVLESTYSILIPPPPEGKDLESAPTAEEFLSAHGYNRGFMTARGLPDNARSARYVLKDFVNGKLLYCHSPPGVNQEDYHKFAMVSSKKAERILTKKGVHEGNISREVDRKFFAMANSGVHTKGIHGTRGMLAATDCSKPWKKHYNRNKKEKLRKVYEKNPYGC